jgi:hypothetical protein
MLERVSRVLRWVDNEPMVRWSCIQTMLFRYDDACVEETKGLLGGLFKFCKKKFAVDQVRCQHHASGCTPSPFQ